MGIIASILVYAITRFIQEIIKDQKAIKESERRTASAIKQMQSYDKEAMAMAEYYQEYATDPNLFKELNELLTRNKIEH